MEGVKEIICDYCKKVCFRSFMGKCVYVPCDCDKEAKKDSQSLPTEKG